MTVTEDLSPGKTVITIDGPAGAGKSTVAKQLANRLGYTYLDTGAMYRAITLKALSESADLNDEEQLQRIAADSTVDLTYQDGKVTVNLDGQDVSEAIRAPEVTGNIRTIANAEGVRKILVNLQRQYAAQKDLVVEGRDVGTVVFPSAHYKFYLDADVQERARRRREDFKSRGDQVSDDQLKQEIELRDQNDMNRKVGALKKADDAIVINSTGLSIDEVVDRMIGIIKHG